MTTETEKRMVKRFYCFRSSMNRERCNGIPFDEFVDGSDYDALERERDALRESLMWANQFAMDVRKKLCEHNGPGWENRCLDKIPALNRDTMYE